MAAAYKVLQPTAELGQPELAMMSPALHAAANALCERLRSAGAGSFMATEEQYTALATSLGLTLPPWLSALLQT